MDQECKKLPLFVIFLLFWGSAYGFKGGDSNSPQSSDNTLSPHAVQSSVSEVPVTGILPEEVGSRSFTNRHLKRLNLLQFVKGHVSSRHESTSQSAPGSSFQGEAAGLGSLETQINKSQETSSHLLPSPVEVSNHSTNGQSAPSILSTQTEGSASTSQGSSEPEFSGSFEQLFPTQVERGSYSGVSQSLSTSSQHSPDYLLYRQFDALPVGVSRQSTNSQSSPSVSTSTKSRSGTITSSHLFPVQGGSYTSSLSLKPPGTLGLYAPASPTKYVGVPMSSYPAVYSQSTSSSGTQFGALTGFASQGMSSTYSGSVWPQGTASQFAPGSPSPYPSVSISSPQGAASQSATVQSSRKQFTSSYGTQSGSLSPFTLQGSTTYHGSLQPQGTTSRLAPGSLSLSSYPSVSLSSPQGAASQSATVQSSRKQFTSTVTGSSGTQEGSSMPLTLQGSTTYRGSLQSQGTPSQFAPGSPSSPQGAASQSAAVQSSRKQFTSSYGTQSGSLSPFTLQGSTTYHGSLQPQGSTSRLAPESPSSPQGAASQSATVQSSQKQFTSTFTGSSGTQDGFSTPLTLQGSTTYHGSLQPQGITSRLAPGSLSSYPSVSLSSPQGASSQSAAIQSSRKQFTSTFTGSSGTQEGSSMPLTLQGSTTYRGSLQSQGTPSQFAPGSPSSPQGAASQSATVQSSRKQFASSYGTQSGSFSPFTLQGSTTYRGSLQSQGTPSQFAPGSPSSPQGAVSQSATVQSSQKQFTSTFTGSSGTQDGFSTPLTLQGSTTYRGSLQPQGITSQFAPGSPSSPQGAASQSATVQSSRKQFASSYGTQSGSFSPFTLQGSTTYRGSLQPQGTTSRLAPGSLSSYPSVSLSSTQGAASQSAAIQSSRKQFTSTFTGSSGTQEGFSMPLTLQGSTTYRGSLQSQGTPSQFAPGSPSSPQGAVSQSATVQSSRKQFTSTFTGSSGTQDGFSTPLTLQASTTYRGSLQPQGTTSQFAPGSPSSYNRHGVSLSSPQGVTSQLSQALQSYSVSQSQKSPRVEPSQGFQTSDATASQGSSLSLSSPMQSRFSSLSSAAGGSSSGDSGQFVSAQGGSTSYGGFSLHSQSPTSKYTPGTHAYAKLGSSPLAVSSQSTSDQRSNGLYSSDSLRSQGLRHVVERPSRLPYQAPSDSPSSNKISKSFVTSQRPAGSNLAPSLDLSAQAPSVGMFSGIPQTAQALSESGSDVQLYNLFSSRYYNVKG